MSNKALIIVDYSFDFIDDNGKLTCGKPGQERRIIKKWETLKAISWL